MTPVPAPLDLPARRITVPQGTLRVFDVGEGPPVVLLHGAPMPALAFVRVVRGLVGRHRVIVPELPGFGASEPTPGFRGELTDYADAIAALLRQLELERTVLYLNDSSACMGIVAAATERERIAGLVIADTVPLPLTGRARPVRWILRLLASAPARWINRTFCVLPRAVVQLAPVLAPFSPEEQRQLLSGWRPEQLDRILDVFGRMATDTRFMERAADAADALRDVPALVLFGAFDPMRLVGGPARWSACFDDAERIIIPLEEHFPILARGAEVAERVADWTQRKGIRA